jgi:hypothetical protein
MQPYQRHLRFDMIRRRPSFCLEMRALLGPMIDSAAGTRPIPDTLFTAAGVVRR